VFLHERQHKVEIADVCLDKHVVRLVFYVLEVGKVSRISQFVEVDDTVLRIFVHEQTHYVAANEAGASSDDDISLKIHDIAMVWLFFKTQR
jgi:excinuclease UvrABC helicase subunit UvrB